MNDEWPKNYYPPNPDAERALRIMLNQCVLYARAHQLKFTVSQVQETLAIGHTMFWTTVWPARILAEPRNLPDTPKS